jgi:hypothetical protein
MVLSICIFCGFLVCFSGCSRQENESKRDKQKTEEVVSNTNSSKEEKVAIEQRIADFDEIQSASFILNRPQKDGDPVQVTVILIKEAQSNSAEQMIMISEKTMKSVYALVIEEVSMRMEDSDLYKQIHIDQIQGQSYMMTIMDEIRTKHRMYKIGIYVDQGVPKSS